MPDEIPCPHCTRKIVIPGRRELPEDLVNAMLGKKGSSSGQGLTSTLIKTSTFSQAPTSAQPISPVSSPGSPPQTARETVNFRCLYCAKSVTGTPDMPDEIPCPHCTRKIVIPGRRDIPEVAIEAMLGKKGSSSQVSAATIVSPLIATITTAPLPAASASSSEPTLERCPHCANKIVFSQGTPPPTSCPHCRKELTPSISIHTASINKVTDLPPAYTTTATWSNSSNRIENPPIQDEQIPASIALLGLLGIFTTTLYAWGFIPEMGKWFFFFSLTCQGCIVLISSVQWIKARISNPRNRLSVSNPVDTRSGIRTH